MQIADKIERAPIDSLHRNSRNVRRRGKRQIKQIAASIRELGFISPIVVDENNRIVCGHGRFDAAKELGMTEVPVIRVDHLSEAQLRILALADNKLAMNSSWVPELLSGELQFLVDEGFDLGPTGFEIAEVELILEEAIESSPAGPSSPDDRIPTPAGPTVSRSGDRWECGRHRVVCGDAGHAESLDHLLGGETVDMIFTDPPFNSPIDGFAVGKGSIHHPDFAMAAGEMSRGEFTTFLRQTLGAGAARARDGAIAYVCMDWRHLRELLEAGDAVFSKLMNLCVWVKSHFGLGKFYRSQHELVLVFKVGTAPHTNNFGMGSGGRHRSNIWNYPGLNAAGPDRINQLQMGPTVKPVALVADAIRDCSNRGGIILDMFGGTGTTLIAAERCGRSARLLEIDPAYCDVIIRRFESVTGKTAIHAETGQSFEERAELAAKTEQDNG